MRIKQYAIIALFGFSLILSSLIFISPNMNSDIINDTDECQVFQNINEVDDERFTISQNEHEGVIDPVSILQSGSQTTDLSRGRIETGIDTTGSIEIDEANGWFVNNTSIEVTDLKRLYGLNGTFDDGTDPWSSYTYDGGSNTQIATYNSSEGFIECKNVGKYNPSGGGYYTHSEYSEVGWEQLVSNTPEALSFRMKFDFRYVTGPLDPDGDDTFDGDVGVFWQLESEGYYYALQEYDSRETWYTVNYVFTVDPGTSSFWIAAGLYIGGGDVDVYVNNDYDDDPAGLADGVKNAQNVTIYIDNIEFTSTTAPTFGDVGLTFHAGSLSNPITGTGTGTATISNPDFWSTSPLDYQVTASANVVFTYSITSLFQRYINSSWTKDLSKHGVTYSVTSGRSSDLTFYTYITEPAGYSDSTFDILYPQDWENTTIWDPLMNNITDLCTVGAGSIHIPTSELSRSGWWEMNLNSLNYAKNISVQIYDQSISGWLENSLFRPGNDTRVQVEIGTSSVTPAAGNPVNISWFSPDELTWSMDSISSMVGGSVTSSSWRFGSANTTAGEWSIDVLWTNGTEIAYESVTFDLYHSASIVVTYPIIETDYGRTVSNRITYMDADTNEFLVDDSVTIEANWSSGFVSFTPEYEQNWWKANFDTSVIGGGRFVVIVTASRPYFDPISTQFTVISLYETSLEITNAQLPIERGRNEVFTAQIDYEFLNGTGIPGALPIITFSGPGGGLTWDNFADNNNGHYSLDITCDISATYEVTITLTKPYHYNTSDSFNLLIGETGSELQLLNGTSDVILFGESYRLLVEYRNSTGTGLIGADVEVVAVTPATGLIHTNFSHYSDGYYEITFNTTEAGTYSVFISAGILNHETQYATFTLTATGIPTLLTSLPSSASIAVDQNFTVQLWFQDESLNPIDSAVLAVVNPPSGLVISNVTPVGGGLYNFTLTPLGIGSYDLLIRASAKNYQGSSAAFTLSATEVPTSLVFEGDVSSALVKYQEPYQLTVYYYRTDSPVSVNVDGADLNVLVQDPGLTVDIVEHSGYYVVTIIGEAIGSWSLTISADKTDHRLATKQFFFEVVKVPISVEVLDGISGLELMTTTLRVNISETETGNPVSGATVFYRIIESSTGFAYGPFPMTETTSPGIYAAPIIMPDADTVHLVEISCESESFELDGPVTMPLIVTRSFTTALLLYSQRYWWAIVSIVGIVGALGYRRTARKRRVRQNKITLAIKRRFDDVRSLLGVIVLHKDSGLPVYSKILRDGLEEAVISAFITAITSFRGEFDIESTTEEWGLIPISDIVRVISTDRLICAFITTGNPSPEQRERMIRFAKTVGFIFDEAMDDVPIVVLDHHTTMQFDALFDDILDGALLRTYTLDDEKKYPTSTCADERIARKQGEEFKLEELANEIAACGLEEGRVYQAIMRALESQLLVTTDESPFATEIIRAPESVEEEG